MARASAFAVGSRSTSWWPSPPCSRPALVDLAGPRVQAGPMGWAAGSGLGLAIRLGDDATRLCAGSARCGIPGEHLGEPTPAPCRAARKAHPRRYPPEFHGCSIPRTVSHHLRNLPSVGSGPAPLPYQHFKPPPLAGSGLFFRAPATRRTATIQCLCAVMAHPTGEPSKIRLQTPSISAVTHGWRGLQPETQ